MESETTPPVIVYMRHGSRGESTLEHAVPSDDPLRLAYKVAADMIEADLAAPQAIIFRGVTHTMDDLKGRVRTVVQAVTDEMVAFLKACVDEDERLALALGSVRFNAYEEGGDDGWAIESEPDGDPGAIVGDRTLAEHIARHDPARVLAEVAAKRRIIDRLDRLREMHQGGHECPGTEDNCGWWPVGDCPTLWEVLAEVRDLASVYAGRPGWRSEWAPA